MTPAARYEAAKAAYQRAPKGERIRRHGVMREALHAELKTECRKAKTKRRAR